MVRNGENAAQNPLEGISTAEAPGTSVSESSGENGSGSSSSGSSSGGSIINAAVLAVMDLIDALDLFAPITRGALGTDNGLCCEVGPSSPQEVYLDKNQFIPLDLTINGKHDNLETLSEAMNGIHEALTMMKEYPAGTDWHITDIVTYTEPQVVGREQNNQWLMASSLSVRIATEKE